MKRGRPTKYDRNYHPHQARLLARDWKTDEQIAKELKISLATHNRWKKRHTEYRQAVTESKAAVDLKVENVLLQRALGYVTENVEERRDSAGNVKEQKITRRAVAPSVPALKLWLRNRQSEQWGDNPPRDDGSEEVLALLEASRQLHGLGQKDGKPEQEEQN